MNFYQSVFNKRTFLKIFAKKSGFGVITLQNLPFADRVMSTNFVLKYKLLYTINLWSCKES